MLLAPVWIEPATLGELFGPSAMPQPTLQPTPVTRPDIVVQPPIGHAPETIVARDVFSRSDPDGWGDADLGGTYLTDDGATNLSVADEAGRILLRDPGTTSDVYLSDPLVRDVEISFSFAIDSLPSDGAVFIYAVVRRTEAGTAYRPKIFVSPTGAVFTHTGVMRTDGERSIGRPAVVPGLTLTPGMWVNVRVVATGSDPTVLRVRAWADGEEEPDYWNFGAIDWTGSLQGIGSLGVAAYLGARHPGGPVQVLIDNLTATTTDLPLNEPLRGAE
jgi:hypothetical protein